MTNEPAPPIDEARPLELETVCCYLCGGEDHEPWAEENGYHAVKCRGCGLILTNPRPLRTEIDEAAETGLHQTEREQINVVGNFRQRRVPGHRRALRALFPGGELRQRALRWLDVGAGFGEFVAAVAAESHPESQVLGIEPCRPKVRIAQAHGQDVQALRLEEIDDRFDVISLMNVYSHLADPLDFLVMLGRRLEPGGELFVQTGNAADVAPGEVPRPLYLPDHLTFAGQEQLKRVLDQAGYDVLRLEARQKSAAMRWIRGAAKQVLGRTKEHAPLRTRYRSLYVRARLR